MESVKDYNSTTEAPNGDQWPQWCCEYMPKAGTVGRMALELSNRPQGVSFSELAAITNSPTKVISTLESTKGGNWVFNRILDRDTGNIQAYRLHHDHLSGYYSDRSLRASRRVCASQVSYKGVIDAEIRKPDVMAELVNAKSNQQEVLSDNTPAELTDNPNPPMTQTELDQIMENYPALIFSGFNIKKNALIRAGNGNQFELETRHIEERQMLRDGLVMVNRALAIMPLIKSRKGFCKVMGSYGIKHVFERYQRSYDDPDRDVYISNGAFIAAALFYGFSVKQEDHGSLNCETVYLNMRITSIDKIDPEHRRNRPNYW